jgi:hypothetical protein
VRPRVRTGVRVPALETVGGGGIFRAAGLERLVLSPKTVKNHVAHVYEKTDISTRAAAAVFAVTNDLLEDGPSGP